MDYIGPLYNGYRHHLFTILDAKKPFHIHVGNQSIRVNSVRITGLDYSRDCIWTCTIPHTLEMIEMARKGNLPEINFVGFTLTKKDAKAFLSWVEKDEHGLMSWLVNLATDGYKLSQSFDLENGCYIVALTGSQRAAHNVACCFTSRAKDLQEALWLSVFKHYQIAGGGQWADPDDDKMAWG